MTQSLSQLYSHIVFSTKNRWPFLKERADRELLHGYLLGICENLQSPTLQVGGTEDHVHILCRLSGTIAIKSLIAELKRSSSKFAKTLSPTLTQFYWQAGYGAFSVSPSHVPRLIQYIANQEAHHQKESFQEEFRRLLKKYNLPYDEQYLWD